ncbi:hypothetical protein [Mangrovicoccus sp. HB161399]|uniref:hypothetical protein n=1 Tax=Mangrovicoccus sp. HB161399 TaxID=2720392 RepID=UPI0015556C03|nr:hypothetical protein [Mangrovicoccus sp. HB161399]
MTDAAAIVLAGRPTLQRHAGLPKAALARLIPANQDGKYGTGSSFYLACSTTGMPNSIAGPYMGRVRLRASQRELAISAACRNAAPRRSTSGGNHDRLSAHVHRTLREPRRAILQPIVIQHDSLGEMRPHGCKRDLPS